MPPPAASESSAVSAPAASRIASVDTLRGLDITLMIFVNDLSMSASDPAWLRHVGQEDAMTLPDIVFPAFLFIMGMSVPLAFSRALDQGQTRSQLFGKALLRAFALLVMGVVMVNREHFEPWARGLWGFLAYLALFMSFSVTPPGPEKTRRLFRGAHIIGAVALGALMLVYRNHDGKAMVLGPLFDSTDTVWLRHAWWGILGLIGWAYFVTSIVYLLAGQRREWLLGAAGLLVLLFGASHSDMPALIASRPWLQWATPVLSPGERFIEAFNAHINVGVHVGSHAAIAVAGCCLGSILVDRSDVRQPGDRLRWAVVFAAGLFVLGLLLDAPYGINKNRATPSWCMYCAALTAAAWAFLYWLMDIRGRQAWSRFFRPAGSNPLLAYVLHPFLYIVVGLAGEKVLSAVFFYHQLSAIPAILGSMIMAVLVVQVTGWIARAGFRLKV
jgi:heparan-alpha-glucosaminide N-acetyltransferase